MIDTGQYNYGMRMHLRLKKMLYHLLCFAVFFSYGVLVAHAETLPKARVYYKADGSVSIEYFVQEACSEGEAEKACMDRLSIKSGHEGMPYDDIDPAHDLPKDRATRDKWRGEKGRGIWVEDSLTTRKEKIEEYRSKIEEELDRERPDPSRVLKLQRMIEKTQEIDHRTLTPEDIAQIENRKQSVLAAVVDAVGDVVSSIFNGVKHGFLALASLVTDALEVGTPEAPAGITVYDVNTKKPYCVVVRDGKMENIPGVCGSADAAASERLSDSSASSSAARIENETNDVDRTPPTLRLIGNNPAEIETGSAYVDPGVTVEDDVSTNIGFKVALDGAPVSEISLDTAEPRTYTITYSATDQAGNEMTIERIVRVVRMAGVEGVRYESAEEGDSEESDDKWEKIEETPARVVGDAP